MKNPLVLFVGAAVVAVAVLAGVTVDRWQDWPSAFQSTAATPETAEPVQADEKLPELVAEAPVEERAEAPETVEIEPARPDEQLPEDVAEAPVLAPEMDTLEPAEELAEAPVAEPDELIAAPERLAAVDPREPEAVAPSQPAAPEPEPEARVHVQPSFDIVRLEDDGSLIVAGRAAPEANVALLLDGEVIATSPANDFGEWLIMPDEPVPPGSHELMVRASDASGLRTGTSQVIALVVPERAEDRPQVALGEPSRPPEAEEDAEEAAEEQIAAAPEPALEEEPETAAPAAEAEAPPSDAEEEQVALAPLPEPVVEPDVTAPQQPEPPAREAEADERAAVAPEPEPEPEAEPEIEPRQVEQGPERLEIPLTLEAVDYNDDGDIVFSGLANPGHMVRIYVDDLFVGETTAGPDGRWVFAGHKQIAPGRHTLRAELTDPTGKQFGRILLPFVRADGREVAALVESRREAAGQQEPAEAVPPEPEPEPEAPVVAEEVVPEPEPEAPVVAEEVVPEPEPEAPVVAEEVVPEPEPEAPVVAEEVVPEPEPEAPVVAEEVVPEPEPEAPVVAEEVAPEPEPEAPVVAEEVVPEPEPEAPVVAEEVVPEPEPEAPVVAEEVVPVAEARA
jgi:hypothetical protein